MRIAIALFDRFTALDAVGPYEVLSRLPGVETVFVGCERRPFRTDLGSLAILADATFDEVSEAGVLVVPGGPGTRGMTTDALLLDWVRGIDRTSRWTTSVCTGSLVLAAAGLLHGVDATTHWGAMAELAALGANPVAERVVVRGKIATAAGVSSGIDLAHAHAARLADETTARAIQLGIEYDPRPPFDSGSAAKASPEILGRVAALMRQRDEADGG